MESSDMVKKIVLPLALISVVISGCLLVLRHSQKTDSLRRRPEGVSVHHSYTDLEGGRHVRACVPDRISITPVQSNEIAAAFNRMAAAYEQGDRDAMLASMESIPDAVTNMPERELAVVTAPMQAALSGRFIHAGNLLGFAMRPDFERFARINLDTVRFFGNLYLRRGADCELQFVYDSQTLKQLSRYKDMFRKQHQPDCEQAADKFISEWINQIESENGFTRRYMWFQVDLQWPRYNEGKITLEELSRHVKSYAGGLIRLGYTPKWLSEFDDLSEAVK